MTADIESMSELVQWGLLQFVSAGILLLVAICVLLVMSWQLTLIALAVLPIVVLASMRFQGCQTARTLVLSALAPTCRPFKKTLRNCGDSGIGPSR